MTQHGSCSREEGCVCSWVQDRPIFFSQTNKQGKQQPLVWRHIYAFTQCLTITKAPMISNQTLGPQSLNITLNTCELDRATCKQTFILNRRTLYLHGTLLLLVV